MFLIYSIDLIQYLKFALNITIEKVYLAHVNKMNAIGVQPAHYKPSPNKCNSFLIFMLYSFCATSPEYFFIKADLAH